MSEKELYAVKNDECEYWDFLANSGFWSSEIADPTTTIRKKQAELVADEHGGHVVTLVEEPEKVVLTKEQAEIVDYAHDDYFPASYISGNSGEDEEEELLINAYVNGYTVEKETKYNVKVPYAIESYFKKIDGKYCIAGNRSTVDLDEDSAQFTEAEIEHYGLQDCERVEINTEDSDDN